MTKFSLATIVRYLNEEYSIEIDCETAAFILGRLQKHEKDIEGENKVG